MNATISKSDSSSLDSNQIEERTKQIGQLIFKTSQKGRYNIFSALFWQTKIMELTTRNPRVKTQLFRFVDVLPVLKTQQQKKEHLMEYLSPGPDDKEWPFLLRLATFFLKIPFLNDFIVRVSDFQVKQMGETFIAGHRVDEALKKIKKARQSGVGFTLDILGEAALSEKEAAYYYDLYLQLISKIGEEAKTWTPHAVMDGSALGEIPLVNISVKFSSIDCKIDSAAYESSIERLMFKLSPLLQLAMQKNVFINFDMEAFDTKELTRETFKRLLMRKEFRDYRHFGIVNQAYLKCAEADSLDWIDFAKKRGTPFTIRLVKGAYWDFEQIIANQNDWEAPVFDHKFESDLSFEKCAALLLEAYPHIELAMGSHNIRSLAYAMAYAESLGLPKNAYEVQMLFGMAESFKKALVVDGVRLREYTPFGEMLPGLSYLVRRLLENTSNDSFLKQSFMDHKGIDQLLESPQPAKEARHDRI